MKKKYLIICLALIFAVILFGNISAVAEKPVKVRLATSYYENHHFGQKLKWIAKELEKRSNDRFECELFFAGAIGGEKELLEDLLLGNVELMPGAGGVLYHYVPELNVGELPGYGWEDSAEVREIMRGYLHKFQEVAGKKGFMIVGIDATDFTGIMYKENFDSLADIKDKNFRAVNSEYSIELTKLFGANPVPLPYSDAYMAFKQGLVEGALIAPSIAVQPSWQEVLKAFWDLKIIHATTYTVTSKRFYDNLPTDLQKIFIDTIKDAEVVNLAQANEVYERAKAKMIADGVTWYEKDDLDRGDIDEKLLKFRDDYMKAKSKEVYDFYIEFLRYVEETTGRKQLQ